VHRHTTQNRSQTLVIGSLSARYAQHMSAYTEIKTKSNN